MARSANATRDTRSWLFYPSLRLRRRSRIHQRKRTRSASSDGASHSIMDLTLVNTHERRVS